MIPKIAHFHWTGPAINWMRMIGIHTFAIHNPTWDVRLIRTAPFILEDTSLLLSQQADWTWHNALYRHGGFAMATDTVFVKPVPEEWLDADLVGCTNGTGNFHHCCVGSRPRTEFFKMCLEGCESLRHLSFPKLGYQAMGVELMRSVADKLGGCGNMERFLDMPMGALCPVDSWNVPMCWEPGPLPITDETIGVTWFGGHESSRTREWDVPEKHRDAAIVKLAFKMSKNRKPGEVWSPEGARWANWTKGVNEWT